MRQIEILGIKIQSKRIEKGYTQAALAEELNVSRTYLNKVEKGTRSPSLSLIFKLAQFFDIEVEDLFDVSL